MIFKANSFGYIVVDDGLKEAMKNRKLSILPKGIIRVGGEFLSGSVIDIKDTEGTILAKGISNYSSSEIESVLGLSSEKANELIGFLAKKGIVYADDMVLLKEDYYGRFVK